MAHFILAIHFYIFDNTSSQCVCLAVVSSSSSSFRPTLDRSICVTHTQISKMYVPQTTKRNYIQSSYTIIINPPTGGRLPPSDVTSVNRVNHKIEFIVVCVCSRSGSFMRVTTTINLCQVVSEGK